MALAEQEVKRLAMVERQLRGRGITDSRVLAIMQRLPRERFLPPALAERAYEDRALAAELGQTISQPYIVAFMSQALHVEREHRVLEVGTGTGYQTAILAQLVNRVCSIERLAELSETARQRVEALGLANVTYGVGDGTLGWAEHAPYDRIIVTAAAPCVIPDLLDQLTEGGRLVIPVGTADSQRLTSVERRSGRIIERPSIGVKFVKLVGARGFDE